MRAAPRGRRPPRLTRAARAGLGNYVGAALITGVNSATNPEWIPDNVNEGRLDLFFLLLAALMAVNGVIFLAIAARYKYQSNSHVADVDAQAEKRAQDDAEAEADGYKSPPAPVKREARGESRV